VSEDCAYFLANLWTADHLGHELIKLSHYEPLEIALGKPGANLQPTSRIELSPTRSVA